MIISPPLDFDHHIVDNVEFKSHYHNVFAFPISLSFILIMVSGLNKVGVMTRKFVGLDWSHMAYNKEIL